MTNFIKAIATTLLGFGIFLLGVVVLITIGLLGYLGLLILGTFAGIYFIKMLYDSVDENAV